MKCPLCGTNLEQGVTTCPMCRNNVPQNEADTPYTGPTKSKTLAGILMLFGLGDFYLLYTERFIKSLILCVPTIGMYPLYHQLTDAYRIFTGKINCDRNGTPLV